MSQKVSMVARLGHTPDVDSSLVAKLSVLVMFWFSPETLSFWQAFPLQGSLLLGVPFLLKPIQNEISHLFDFFFCF